MLSMLSGKTTELLPSQVSSLHHCERLFHPTCSTFNLFLLKLIGFLTAHSLIISEWQPHP